MSNQNFTKFVPKNVEFFSWLKNEFSKKVTEISERTTQIDDPHWQIGYKSAMKIVAVWLESRKKFWCAF